MRRALLAGGLLAPVIGAASARALSPFAVEGSAWSTTGWDAPVIETSGGKVRGIAQGDVLTFKGIPYAGAPIGDHRFARAPDLIPWQGVRRALNFGPICPMPAQAPRDRTQSVFSYLVPEGQRTDQSEDCLRLNIWAPRDLAGGRPVMVWLHAGGFRYGYAQQYAAANGHVIAGRGDALVVSLNHRLGPLAHLDLSQVEDPALAESGNVGMLDIIDALRWIKQNIAAFGGDPDNITVFGQSGGGYKVSVLLAMPEARALFNRAIIQSGARLRVHDPSITHRQTDLVLREFGLMQDADAVRSLRALPVDAFLQAVDKTMMSEESRAIRTPRWSTAPFWFEPVAGTAALPHQPGAAASMHAAKDISLIVGSNRNEISLSGNQPHMEAIDWAGVQANLIEEMGPITEAAIAKARQAFPAMRPIEILSVLKSRRFRVQSLEFARRAAEAGNERVFNYEFAWHTPLFSGRPRAFHSSEVAFVFDTLDLIGRATGPEDRALASEMSARWSAYARAGVPAVEGAARWPRFSTAKPTTMVFDTQSKAAPPSDLELVQFLLNQDVTGQRHHG